jgi:hypothetical protein
MPETPDQREARRARFLEEARSELRRGGALDAAAWQARYPDLAAEVPALLEGLGPPEPTTDEEGRVTRAPAAPAPERLPGQVGRYRVLGKIGRGGMGVVYKAHDPDLDRVVAVKVPRFDPDEPECQRFLREARVAAAVRHPHVCPIYDVGVQGVPYVVMAYVEGGSLDDRLRRQGRYEDPGEAVRLAVQVARGLAAVHACGIVHRDLKPANILLDAAGDALLTDFGLARPGEADARLTPDGAVLGTPSYMAPEQAAGEPGRVDVRTDVYGLGVVLYEMLTGRVPFEGPALALLSRIQHEAAPPPSRFRPGLDPALEGIVRKAMALRNEDRFQSAAEFAAALGGWTPGPKPGRRTAGRGGVLLGLAAALIVAVVLLAVIIPAVVRLRSRDPGKPAAPGPQRTEEQPARPVLKLYRLNRAPGETQEFGPGGGSLRSDDEVRLVADCPPGRACYLLTVRGDGATRVRPAADIPPEGPGWRLDRLERLREPTQTVLLLAAAEPLSEEECAALAARIEGLGAPPPLPPDLHLVWEDGGCRGAGAESGPARWASDVLAILKEKEGLRFHGLTLRVEAPVLVKTFTGKGGPIADALQRPSGPHIPSTTKFAIKVSLPDGDDPPTFDRLADLDVIIALVHPHLNQVSLTLVAPDGTAVKLLLNRTDAAGNEPFPCGLRGGANLGVRDRERPGTVFNHRAPRSITDPAAEAPFIGRFRPESVYGPVPYLNTFTGRTFDKINGSWELIVTDFRNDGRGPPPVQFLDHWSLRFTLKEPRRPDE